MPETWTRADAYEPYVGRWSRAVAPRFLAWAAIGARTRVLDVGCGTGAVAEAALNAGAASVAGIDSSADFVETARRRMPRARFDIADATNLPFPDGSFDAVVSGLVLNFLEDPPLAVAEMVRATRRGGTVAAYVWDYAGGMGMMRHFWTAATEQDPAAAAVDDANRFPLARPEPLTALFRDAGLQAVETGVLEIETAFRNFDDFWTPFLGGSGPAPAYCMKLSVPKRIDLRERLRRRLPVHADGSIHLVARAWAVRGRKAG